MLISETRVIPYKNHTKCPRCERRMVSCSYKNYLNKGKDWKFVKVAYYCKTCKILFPIESNTD